MNGSMGLSVVAGLALAVLAAPAPARPLSWHRCAGARTWQCATATVPADYADRSAGSLRLAVTRHRARRPGRHRHAVFLNYGGPGAAAVGQTHTDARFLLGSAFRRLDVVAFDPRGTGASRPAIDCDVDQETGGLYGQPFPRPATADPIALAARAQAYVDRCLRRNPRVLPFVSTAANARDMDRIRAAIGVRRLDYLGFSYGTLLGATYAALFSHHLRALVLDGPVDPEAYLNDPARSSARQTQGFERALGRFLRACDRRRHGCAFSRRGRARAAFDGIVARADAHPLRVRRPRRRRVDGDDVRVAAVDALYSKFSWPDLADALGEARRGDGAGIRRLADEFYERRPDGSFSPSLDRYFAITAVEQAYPAGIAPYLAAGPASYRRFPHFWFNSGWAELPYGLYPVAGRDVFRGPFTLPPTASGTPLVVGTTHDPATPYAGARRMVAELGRARLLTMRGDGHTATGGNSRCIDRAVRRYLLTTRLPPRGTTCRQHVPFAAAARTPVAGPRR
jgi:pimeloyl-ACP methyl ester carboxylesterase